MQASSGVGFKTTYTYYPGGKLATITQYANGSTQQLRSFTYDNNNTGRLLTTTTPESGTSATTYDSDPSGVCPAFVGLAVKSVDNAGGMGCFQYDLADRVISETFLGPNSSNTAAKSFIYDASSNSHLSCTNTNAAGKLVEVATGTSTTASVAISGTEQSYATGTRSSGSVTINTYEAQFNSPGTIVINVNSIVAGSYHFASGMPGRAIAQAQAQVSSTEIRFSRNLNL